MAKIGIDFGTSNTSVSYVDNNGEARAILGGKRPSALYYAEDYEEPFKGKDAIDYAKLYEGGMLFIGLKRELSTIAIKHTPKGRAITVVELVGEYLKWIKEKAEEEVFQNEKITEVCITHPVEFSPNQKEALKRAAKLAGFTNVTMALEPVAAAMGYLNSASRQHGYVFKDETLLIFDFGGGTLDLAVIESGREDLNISVEPLGDNHCGGHDIDCSFYDWLDTQFFNKFGEHISENKTERDPRILTNYCESTKEFISRSIVRDKTLPLAPLIAKGKLLKLTIDYNKWQEIISPTISRAMKRVQDIIELAKKKDLTIDKVILIGGSSAIKDVSATFESRFGLKCYRTDDDRDVAVSKGAALFAEYGDVPRKCYCGMDGKQLWSNMKRCPDCGTWNYFYNHKFDGRE